MKDLASVPLHHGEGPAGKAKRTRKPKSNSRSGGSNGGGDGSNGNGDSGDGRRSSGTAAISYHPYSSCGALGTSAVDDDNDCLTSSCPSTCSLPPHAQSDTSPALSSGSCSSSAASVLTSSLPSEESPASSATNNVCNNTDNRHLSPEHYRSIAYDPYYHQRLQHQHHHQRHPPPPPHHHQEAAAAAAAAVSVSSSSSSRDANNLNNNSNQQRISMTLQNWFSRQSRLLDALTKFDVKTGTLLSYNTEFQQLTGIPTKCLERAFRCQSVIPVHLVRYSVELLQLLSSGRVQVVQTNIVCV
jgi:hypothetical protein